MKKILFIVLFLFLTVNVYAETKTETFYSGEWISGIYINKVKSGVIHYRQARFIRKKSDSKVAYCIEPFEDMKTSGSYSGYDNDYAKRLGISDSKWNKINLIAYYGYGYNGHTDEKWYAVTQVMIWREIDSNASFYFTDKLNGNKISSYDDEINEINNLVNSHSKLPSFANKTYTYSINSINEIVDLNGVLNGFIVTQNKDVEVSKNGNKLIINTKGEVSTKVSFEKKFNKYNLNTYVFVDNSYQNLISPGDVSSLKFDINLEIIGGKIKITKLDYDSESKKPSGEGILIGTKYSLFDENNNIIEELIIDENNESNSSLLSFGKYYLKEKEAMKGYTIDENTYEIIINQSLPEIELTLKNKVIKSIVQIYKYFGENFESGISFEIYDSNDNLIDTVTTDENGKIEKELSYGKYTFHQLNSTKNYKSVDDFEVIIDSSTPNEIKIDLNDEKFSSKLIVTKRDSKTGEVIEEETIFKIYDILESKYIKIDNSEELKTKSGKITIDNLEAGEYYLEEFRAPNGYSKRTDKIKFVIDDSNSYEFEDDVPLLSLDFYDDKEKIEIDVPDTNQEIEQIFVAVIYDEKKKLTSFLC